MLNLLNFVFGTVNINLLSDRNKILNNEQKDNWITLKSKSIMQRNSLFPKK